MRNIILKIGLLFFMMIFVAPIFSVFSGQGAEIIVTQVGIEVTGQGATYLQLRISGPEGQIVCDKSSDGAPLNWNITEGLPDGHYSYEVRQSTAPKRTRRENNNDEGPGLNYPVWVDSGGFLVERGFIVRPKIGETGALDLFSSSTKRLLTGLSHFLVASVLADIVHNDDVIINPSVCVGWDCVDGESFNEDTIKLKENNLRIYFDDISIGTFPSNDWRILINDTTAGGSSYFSVEDTSYGRRPFTIEAGAPANSFYVEDTGRIGLGTSIPIEDLHIVDGDSPTIRLEQDGSSYTPQSWDILSNETNFMIRDVSHADKMPFRIQPGTPSDTLTLKSSGNVGIGTWGPTHTLHVKGDALVTGNLELGSSRSFKNNITALNGEDAVTALVALQPVRFNYQNSPDEESVGFIAEDVPDLVATKSRKSLSTMDLVAVLTKVVQEQQMTINRLEQSLSDLKQQVTSQ